MTAPLLALAALACGCVAATVTRTGGPDGQARIEVDRGETYVVRALFDGVATEALTYRLEALREGAAGRSQSSQGGAFEAAAGRADTLSTLRVSALPGDHFHARLVVSRDGEPVSESVVEETVR